MQRWAPPGTTYSWQPPSCRYYSLPSLSHLLSLSILLSLSFSSYLIYDLEVGNCFKEICHKIWIITLITILDHKILWNRRKWHWKRDKMNLNLIFWGYIFHSYVALGKMSWKGGGLWLKCTIYTPYLRPDSREWRPNLSWVCSSFTCSPLDRLTCTPLYQG